MTNITRRSLAKGAVWSAPAVAVAAAAPALAASCTPTTVNKSSAVTWTSTQTDFNSPTGDPEFHTVQYTFTNTGPDALVAGFEFDINLLIAVSSGEDVDVTVTGSSNNVTASATNSVSPNAANGTDDDAVVVKLVTTQDVAVNGTFTVTVLAKYGFIPSGQVDESVSAKSPLTTTDEATCITTVAAVTLSGQSDGTSYTTP